MPNVREVYEMVTKQKRPEPGALDRQQRRQVRAARNKKRGAFAVTVAIALTAVALILGTRAGRNPTTPADERPTAAPETSSAPFFLDLRTGVRTPLPETLVPEDAGAPVNYVDYSVSPDGTRLAYGTCLYSSCSSVDEMGVGNIDGTSARKLRVPQGLNGYLPRWSPDGSKLVYQLRSGGTNDVGNLFLEDVSSGRRTQLTDLELSNSSWWFLSARFSPDGQSVIFHLPRVQFSKWDVWSVPVTGGEPTLVLRDAAFPEYFPDGKTIAFVEPRASSPGGVGLQIADAGGSRRTLVEANGPLGIWWPEISPDGTKIAYQDGGSIYVVDVSTGESSKVAEGDNAEWLDDDTLIVAP